MDISHGLPPRKCLFNFMSPMCDDVVAQRSKRCTMVYTCWNPSWYVFILKVGLASSPLTTSIMLGNSFLWDDHLGRDPCLVLSLWVQRVGSKPFMLTTSYKSFSSLVSCKPTTIITRRKDDGLIKMYLKLEG